MDIIVGFNNEPSNRDALALGQALASTLGANLVVATIYPVAFDYPGAGHVDAEWRAFVIEQAEETLAWARKHVTNPDDVSFVAHGHRSSGVGLSQIAAKRGAAIIVIGSAPGGSEGRITGGSTADQLFHGAPSPVAVAPQGYHCWAPEEIHRFVVAYQRTRESDHCLAATLEAYRRSDMAGRVQLHVLTLVERVTKIYSSRLGHNAEDQVMATLREQAAVGLRHASKVAAEAGVEATTSVVEGDKVVTSLSKFDWHSGDVFVLGSTDTGPIKRVFLGDMTYKLIRAATVPVVVVPRRANLPD